MYWCFFNLLTPTPQPHTLAQTIYFFPVSLKTRPPKYNHRAATIATGGRAYCSIKKRKSHAGYIAKNKNIINQCPGQGGRSSWKLVSSLLPCLWLRLSQIRAPWEPPAIAAPGKRGSCPKNWGCWAQLPNVKIGLGQGHKAPNELLLIFFPVTLIFCLPL